jgi:hypothetical protein
MNDITLKAEERQGWTAVGHRVGNGLFDRDDPARASVGKCSCVSPRGLIAPAQRAGAIRGGVHAGGASLAPLALDQRLQSLRLRHTNKTNPVASPS